VLKGTAFRGNPLNFVTEVPAAASTAAIETNDSAAGTGGQKAWRYLTITKKNRPQPKPVAKKVERKRAPSFSSSSSDSGLSDTEPIKPTVARKSSPVLGKEDVVEPTKDVVDEIVVAGKKRPAKPKASTKNKKAKLEPAPLVEIPAPDELPVAEIKIEPTVVKPKPKKAAASPIDKLIETGVIADDEDAYWLGQALAEIEPIDEAEADEQEIVPEDHPLYHQSGSWRAEGFKSIPKTRKSEYLPQQNKAAVAQQDAAALTSGRTARVTGRRLAHDIETTRRSTTTQTSETDTFAFNQLRTRKKQLKFSRSPIEGYGLYAMETIAPGEMVCEYVGEIVRSAVAEVREQRYLKQGIGSSYLFRIDAEVVCDATFRGSVR
jgi:histone-lysine N-methyltransferase SETD1